MSQLQADLQRSESRANQLELQLQSSRKHMENDANADNYLREELGRMRREADQTKERVREMKKAVSAEPGNKFALLSNADALDKSLDMKRTEVREDLSNFSRTFYESIELIRILKYTVLP